MTIFRTEVLDSQRTRLEGNVSLAVPISWQIVGLFFFTIVSVAIGFLLFGNFSRIETVSGVIEPADGVARIVPPVSGTMDEVFVKAGDVVSEGSSLAVVRTELTTAEGVASSEAEKRISARERRGIERQESEIAAAARSRAYEIDREITDRQSALQSLSSQISIQEELLETAREDLEQARAIADRGFISKRDIDLRRETYVSRQQDLLRLQRELTQNRNAISELAQRKSTVRSEAGAQIASLAAQRSDIARRGTRSSLEEAYRLDSPVDGRIAVVAAQRGEFVSTGEPVMLVLPAGSTLTAELKVPSAAIGFLERGQTVKLAIDAFPSEHFGTLDGKIESIASAPIVDPSAPGGEQPHFLVTVSLPREWVRAGGDRRPLVAGMACTATIVTEERTLLEWLLEPLLSA